MNDAPTRPPVDVLLVEDSRTDVRLIQEAFKLAAAPATLHVVHDGEAALAFLHRTGEHADARRPGLILLDWNIPLRDSRDVLREIKADPQLGAIPVCVLSGSDDADQVRQAYALHANCYLTKPPGLPELIDCVDALSRFWLCTAQLP